MWIWITSSLNVLSGVLAREVDVRSCMYTSDCPRLCCLQAHIIIPVIPPMGAPHGCVFGLVQLCSPNNCVIPPVWAMISLQPACVCARVCVCVPDGLSSLWLSCNTTADDAQLDERAGRALLSPCGYVVDCNGAQETRECIKVVLEVMLFISESEEIMFRERLRIQQQQQKNVMLFCPDTVHDTNQDFSGKAGEGKWVLSNICNISANLE